MMYLYKQKIRKKETSKAIWVKVLTFGAVFTRKNWRNYFNRSGWVNPNLDWVYPARGADLAWQLLTAPNIKLNVNDSTWFKKKPGVLWRGPEGMVLKV